MGFGLLRSWSGSDKDTSAGVESGDILSGAGGRGESDEEK